MKSDAVMVRAAQSWLVSSVDSHEDREIHLTHTRIVFKLLVTCFKSKTTHFVDVIL